MIWFIGYLVVTFLMNHGVAHVLQDESSDKNGVLLNLSMLAAVVLRLPFHIAVIVLYTLCCIGTIVAASADVVPERPALYWLLALADNLGYACYALRGFLVHEFAFVRGHAKSNWSCVYYVFQLGNGRIFSWKAELCSGERRHEVGSEIRARRSIQQMEAS